MFDAFANFHFIRPWWLLLVPVVLVVWKLWQSRSDPLRGWRMQMDAELLRALTVDTGGTHRREGRLWLAGSLLAVIAIAGPTWRREPSPFAEDASPLMILLKAGDSMSRGDLPATPLERAKLKISDLAKLRRGQPLGLIAYAGSSHLVLPPTRDTDVVATIAAEIDPDVMPVSGDRLDLAIQEAGRLLAENEAGGSLLVVADSVESDPNAVAAAVKAAGAPPVQFLVLAADGSPEAGSIATVASTIDATVQRLTADDEDVTSLANAAARRSLAGVAGKSSRWEEAGYWLVPLIALLAALAFRRETIALKEPSP